MRFGPVALEEAEGAVLAHSLQTATGVLRKGHVLGAADLVRLAGEGVTTLVVARLAPDDVAEDDAALALASAVAGDGISRDQPFTGRVNLYATGNGVLLCDREAINRFNRVDPAITLATLPACQAVEAGRMVATVKIIPLAVPGGHVAAAADVARGCVRLAPYRARPVGLVATRLPHLKPATMDKTRRVLADRLAPMGGVLLPEIRTAHTADAVAEGLRQQLAAGAGLVVLFGASAVVDVEDVLPAAIRLAGGELHHFGMPVDPGNLLLLGEVGGVPVLGAPGCARSPKENGFDWILQRLMADIPVTAEDITGLGVGGLLMEITSRPQLRAQPAGTAGRHGAIVLAAGRSSRMEGGNKLLARLNGKTLVAHALDAACDSAAGPVVLVTGHMAERVAAEAAGRDVVVQHNPDFATGMASSIRAGLAALPAGLDGVVILLGDMPGVDAAMVDRLIRAHDRSRRHLIVVATAEGKRGNPVLFDSAFLEALKGLEGDVGARHLIAREGETVVEVELGVAARLDLDTRDALTAAGGEMNGD
ncbi:NTP transferase domain-containing protein [Pannonibacter tanglangensis]|uniref:NTP transferase domain-containing protein n=1 Tax=Pannonibacter tanglangensis TaxID=2750084 RepID=A0ABW9ZL17_9HYPH|nr:molybdopterin-binding/glycosyltransferase family 2 protein [Pannonibacter sp. XCT-34]NBN64996.1 NTP transferase domain-containing protein [Pannonibacter sp. XCT-34]